nr:SDR family NAD(P)-dependent oxidoreductase [Salibaculum halophilum]
MEQTWIILGASSTMARALMQKLAEAGAGLVLAGRRMDDLQASASDALARGAALAEPVAFDARDPDSFQPVIDRALDQPGQINCAVFVGSMPPQAEIDADPGLLDGVIADSFTGPARFLQMLAPHLEARGSGTVVGVGSVAGDRGRIGNYVYGGAKGGFATYLSGLRNRLGRSGVHVLTVKPGPVDTAMTQGMEGLPFPTTAEAVAEDILAGVGRGRDVLYTRRIWWPIMLVIRAIPEHLFKKMSI